jgi:hypothetical protein
MVIFGRGNKALPYILSGKIEKQWENYEWSTSWPSSIRKVDSEREETTQSRSAGPSVRRSQLQLHNVNAPAAAHSPH